MMYREQDYRRPDFKSGIAVRLADGQTWTFPDATAGGVGSSWADYEAILEALLEAEEEADFLQSELVLAVHLLCQNYRLSPPILQDLLDFGSGLSAPEAMGDLFRDMVMGHMRAFGSVTRYDSRTWRWSDIVKGLRGRVAAGRSI